VLAHAEQKSGSTDVGQRHGALAMWQTPKGGGSMRDMNEVLERWGVWARDNSGIDYSPIAAGFRGLLSYKSKGERSCCDDDGLVIDGCVGRLKKYKPEEFDLIIAHHVYGISLRKIALKRKCSDGTIRKEMQTAEGFIGGCLAMLDIKLTMDR
jgi:hypothetical protein